MADGNGDDDGLVGAKGDDHEWLFATCCIVKRIKDIIN